MTETVTELGGSHLGSRDVAPIAEEGENDDEYDEEEYEEEAEEIARRLKDQLWADISKAQAAQANERVRGAQAPPGVDTSQTPLTQRLSSKKESAALETMKSILALTARDTVAHSILSSTLLPATADGVLEVLRRTVDSGTISKVLARTLSPVLVSLARCDKLFATMRNSNAPAAQLDKGKRRREESDEEQRLAESRAPKRHNTSHHAIQQQLSEAVQVVSIALSASPTSGGPLDPSVISPIQLQLHQIFLFAVTSSAGGGPEMHALQEIGGLIQVIGVLSGIQIGAPPGPTATPSASFCGISAAVYPCLVSGCRKTFSRLFSLRAHGRIHAVYRPFRCAACPASFARNHDLKRHAKLHEKKAWQCVGCEKMFSRRDAIKRHKNSSAARGGKGEMCVNAAVQEVELSRDDDEDLAREGRRTRMWSEIATQSVGMVTAFAGYGENGDLEEGEVQNDVIRRMQEDVLGLHAMLQASVSMALGTGHAAPPLHLDPTGGQATLASVIARAQMQNTASQPQASTIPASHTHEESSHRGHSSPNPAHTLIPTVAVEEGMQPSGPASAPQLSLYGLSEEQKKLLEQAIANAASAAQAQAEAEAALEEDEDSEDDGEDDSDEAGDVGGVH